MTRQDLIDDWDIATTECALCGLEVGPDFDATTTDHVRLGRVHDDCLDDLEADT